ncbi:MAG: hypothetical protein AAFU67_02645 [Bacteroidota bacterium]
MYDLAADYHARLEAIAEAIQGAEVLQQYLDEEEDIYYQTLKDAYEPYIEEIQLEVADKHPLQLEAFERALLDDRFEGLYLPRILGFSVLRGEINDYFKYARQQDHFGDILKYIAGNANFDQLRGRIGQSIQIGFALSSDIWVTSVVDSIGSKQVRQFLLAQKKDENRVVKGRARAYTRYARQFRNRNYQSAHFPKTKEELSSFYNAVKQFLLYRVSTDFDNSSLLTPLHDTVTNPEFAGIAELHRLAVIYGAFFDPSEEHRGQLVAVFNRERKVGTQFADELLSMLLEFKGKKKVKFGPDEERRLSTVVDKSFDDQLTAYFTLTDKIHNDGYINPPVHEAIASEILNHQGLSDFNENIRQTIYGYFARFVKGIGTDGYAEWFELTGKQFAVFIQLFGNEAFSQQLKELAVKYTKSLIKAYPDKRGKDYREIKKTTVTTFQDWGFMTEKQLKEFFKTPRKKKEPIA